MYTVRQIALQQLINIPISYTVYLLLRYYMSFKYNEYTNLQEIWKKNIHLLISSY